MARGHLRFETDDEPAPKQQIDKALAAVGLYCVEEIVLEDEFWLWPENAEPFKYWLAVQTQWDRASVGGGMGPQTLRKIKLDYQGIQACFVMHGLSRKKITKLFPLIQAMEQAALDEWARNT